MKKIVIFSIIVIFSPVIILGVCFLRARIEQLIEWNKIKKDYEIITNIVIKYYDKNSDILKENRKYMSFEYDESYSFLIAEEYVKTNQKGKYENKKFKIDLTKEQQTSLKNIANFYPQQEVISVSDSDVTYHDEMVTGACRVTYVRNIIKKDKVDLDGFTHLTGRWYYFYRTR